MTLLWASLLLVAVTALAVTAMLLARRRAPEGSHFVDGDRAAGVFGVLATGFAILGGFVVFLAFESYDTSRSGAESEAQIVAQQFETAQFMPVAVRHQLGGELICYARNVVHEEWPAMEAGNLGNSINPWGIATFRTLKQTEPRSAAEQSAFGKWLDQRSDRESARSDRVHGAEGVIPVPLWIVLFMSAGIIFVFLLFFADPSEAWFVQATMMGGVTIIVSSMLLLLWFLDNPYHDGPGGLRPIAMERTLGQLAQAAEVVGGVGQLPCDLRGTPRR